MAKKVKSGYSSSRMYGGRTYWLHRVYDTKGQAQTVAKGLRQLGWKARVAKAVYGYGVYRRKT